MTVGTPNSDQVALTENLTPLPDGAVDLGNIRFSSTDMGTIAAAGTTLATGTTVPYHATLVTGASGTNGVTLPTMNIGETYNVGNANASNALLVYPSASTIKIQAGAAGAAYSVAASAGISFTLISATQILAQ
ncbi:unnamed protein product [Sphagnum balticum]